VLQAASRPSSPFVEALLDKQITAAALSHADRALTTEIVYGVTRRRLTLDWIIEHYASRPLDKLDPLLRLILQVALYQLLFMDKVPEYAAVNEAVKAAKRDLHAGAGKFANGLLRTVLRAKDRIPYPSVGTHPIEHFAVVHSYPRWLIRRWLTQFGHDQTAEICAAGNQAPPITLRANRLKVSSAELIEHLQHEGAQAALAGGDEAAVLVRSPKPLPSLDAFAQGECYVQDITAMSVARLLDPQPGEQVLDLCAAPGGKTSHCAELMNDTGRVVACDLDEKRIEMLRANMARLGLTCVEPARCDAHDVPKLMPQTTFDRVLLDAPCSNTGVLRRRVEARWRISEQEIESLSTRQAELLQTGARMVRPGGILVYSTCSIEHDENQDIARGFLSRHGEFRLEGEMALLPAAGGGDGGYMARLVREG